MVLASTAELAVKKGALPLNVERAALARRLDLFRAAATAESAGGFFLRLLCRAPAGALLLLLLDFLRPADLAERLLRWGATAAFILVQSFRRERWLFSRRAAAGAASPPGKPADEVLSVWELLNGGASVESAAFLSASVPGTLASPFRGYSRPLWVGAGASVLFFAASFLFTENARLVFLRAWLPWAAPAATVQLLPGDARVPEGGSLSVSVRALSTGGGMPRLFARDDARGAPWTEVPLSAAPDGSRQARFEGIVRPLLYRGRHRGLWSKTFRVTPYVPPRLTRISWTVSPPAYTGLPVERWENVTSLRVPEGSVLAAEASADRNLLSARLISPDGRSLPVSQRGRMLNFSVPLRGAGVFSLQILGEDGDRAEIPLSLQSVPDLPPSIRLLSPLGESVFSPRERVPVVYEASDDHGLVSARLEILRDGAVAASLPFPSSPAGVLEGAFRPSPLGLEVGAVFSARVVVRDVSGRESAGELFHGRVEDSFAERRALDKALDDWRASLEMAAADEGLLLKKLTEGATAQVLAPRQRLLSEGLKDLSRALSSLTDRMARSPGADPDLMEEHRAVAERLAALERGEASRAAEALSSGDPSGAAGSLSLVVEELDRLRKISDDSHRAARARDVASRGADLSDPAQSLLDAASAGDLSPEARARMDALMSDIAEGLSQVAESLMARPDLMAPPGSDVPPDRVLKMEDIFKDLAEVRDALARGDAAAAERAARRLREKLAAMKDLLSRAGAGAAGSAESAEISKEIEDIARRQEEVRADLRALWDDVQRRSAADPREVAASSSSILSPAEETSLIRRSGEQENLFNRTRSLSDRLEALAEKTARMPPEVREKISGAAEAMDRAGQALRGKQPVEALAAQDEALRLLSEGKESMPSPSPSGSGAMGGAGPRGGSPSGARPTGPVRLPRAGDYRPPKEFREDVLRALEEKTPARDRPLIEEYFKRWAK